MTRDDYYSGTFDWRVTPRLTLDEERVARPRGPLFEAAAQAREARQYLTWTRFPAVEVEPGPNGGTLVRFFDMRYRSMDRIVGPTVRLDATGSLRQRLASHSSSSLRGGMSSTRSVHWISGQTCTRDLNFQPFAVFSNVSS